MTRSLDLPALGRIDTLAQELAMLQDRGKRRIAVLGSRHVPVVSIHLVELVARSLAQEGHNLITSGAQGVNSAVIRSVLEVDPGRLTVLLPQSLERQPLESRDQLELVLHLVEKPEHDELPLPMASMLPSAPGCACASTVRCRSRSRRGSQHTGRSGGATGAPSAAESGCHS